MAPIKFEEQLKDRLEKRTLSPSADGWSKLSERLEVDEKKSKNPLFWWLSIAAGLIIMIAIAVQGFNKSDREEVLPQVVEEQIEEEQIEEEQIEEEQIEEEQVENKNLNNTKSIELAIENETIEDEKESSERIKEPQIIDYKKVTHKKNKAKTELADRKDLHIKNEESKNGEELNNELPVVTKESMMKDAVTDALNDLKSENTVTDREIDSLLKLASKELFKDKLQKETSKTVDANALLLSVEEDMGQSFRSVVFDALKGGYKTVKTAVAERNN